MTTFDWVQTIGLAFTSLLLVFLWVIRIVNTHKEREE